MLRISSFNCHSIRKNVEVVKELMCKHHIVFIQETMLTEDDTGYLSLLNDNFEYAAVPSSINYNLDSCGRPQGGLAIYWNKSLKEYILPIFLNNRTMGIEFIIFEKRILFLNAYLPCDYRDVDSLVSYRSALAEITVFLDNATADEVILTGDLNCDPNKGRFYREFTEFTHNFNFEMIDLQLPADSFTYLSPGNNTTTSWLDHLVVSNVSNISGIQILYGMTLYDHIPLSFNLDIPNLPVNLQYILKKDEIVKELIRWDKLKDADIDLYATNLSNLINNYDNIGMMCTKQLCNDANHAHQLDNAFKFIIDAMHLASSHLKLNFEKTNKKIVVGWNDHCKELHKIARNKFLEWKEGGRVRFGPLYDSMKNSRRDFKKALDYCKRNELKLKQEKILASFDNKNKSHFWKKINEIKNAHHDTISIIDGKTNNKEIADLFSNKYKSILDNNECQSKPLALDMKLEALQMPIIKNKIFEQDIYDAITNLNIGLGYDLIHSNHLKFAGFTFYKFISRLFSAFISHSHVPYSVMYGEIRPIIKDKFKDKHSSDNYRPIMNSSNLLKVLEYCLLVKFEKFLKLNPRQFGFRKQTSCLMATTILKETIMHYKMKHSNTFCAFIDLKKAFDKVNHNILLEKLIDKQVSSPLIFLLKDMLNKQYVSVHFNEANSFTWKIGNGVRQGGILSPLLFNFYINEIIEVISELNVGCEINCYRTNLIAYADDVVLIAPSVRALQFLINTFVKLIDKLNLSVNEQKTVCMIFKCRKRDNIVLEFFINDTIIKIVSEYKYLGIIINEKLSCTDDIKRSSNAFLRQFYGLYRKFYFTDFNVFRFLFISHCMSFYGVELWNDLKGSMYEFHAAEVTYHKKIKQFLGFPVWQSNHFSCEVAGLPIFKHLVNRRILSFAFLIYTTKSPCLQPLIDFLKFDSRVIKNTQRIFNQVYGVQNFLENDFGALNAKINYVQFTE